MWFIKFILLGPPGLGKTTVRRRITGRIVDLESAGEAGQLATSTNAKESEHSVAIRNLSTTSAVVGITEWKLCEDLVDEASALLQFIYSDKKATESKPVHQSADHKEPVHADGVSNLDDGDIKESGHSSPTNSSISTRGPMPQTLTSWIKLLRENLPGKSLKDITFKRKVFCV